MPMGSLLVCRDEFQIFSSCMYSWSTVSGVPSLLYTSKMKNCAENKDEYQALCFYASASFPSRQGEGDYLEIVHNSDVGGRYFPDGVVDHSVSLRTRDATGRQDLVILVHTKWFPTQVFNRQCLTAAQQEHNIYLRLI